VLSLKRAVTAAVTCLAVLAPGALAQTPASTTPASPSHGHGLAGCDSTETSGGYAGLGRCDNARPVPVIGTLPTQPRAGGPLQLQAFSAGSGVTFAWDLDDDGAFDDAVGATVDRSLATDTRVRVRATDADGRTGTAVRPIDVHAGDRAPTAWLTTDVSHPRIGASFEVTVSASDVDGAIARVDLDLDADGSFETSTTQPDRFAGGGAYVTRDTSFASAGSRTLRARVADDGGNVTQTTTTVQVHEENVRPVAGLYAGRSAANPGEAITLYAGGHDPDGQLVNYEFDRDGDGTYETDPDGASASVTFDAPGTYEVGTRVTDDSGATAESRRTVQVKEGNDPPSAGIYPTGGDPRALSAAAWDPDGRVVEFAWDLDGDHVYDDLIGERENAALLPATDPGTYEVGLRVTDDDGAAETARRLVILRDEPPVAPAIHQSAPAPRVGEDVRLSADYQEGMVYAWDTDGDGELDDGTAASVVRSYDTPGPRTVRVRVSDRSGRTATGRHVVTISPASGNRFPEAGIFAERSRPRAGVPTPLRLSGGDSDGTIAARAWDVDGDGQFDDGDGSSTTVTFAAGERDVAVRVTDDDGASTVQRRTFTVHEGNLVPRAGIHAPGGSPVGGEPRVAVGQTLTLAGFGDGRDDAVTEGAWDLDGDGEFDDGTALWPDTVSTSFATAGRRQVRLRVRDEGGAEDVAALLVDVREVGPNRVPRFELYAAGAARLGRTVVFDALGGDPDGGAVTYAWDLDEDGEFDDATGSSASRSFASVGPAVVRARASDGRGGVTTQALSVDVRGDDGLAPTLGVTPPAAVSAGQPARFWAYGWDPDGGPVSYSFDLDGDGVYDDTPDSQPYPGTFHHAFSAPVTVGVRATDTTGRTATRTFDVEPAAGNLPPAGYVSVWARPAGEASRLFAWAWDLDSARVATIAWDLDGDGDFDDGTGAALDPVFGTPGERTVSARVTDDGGAVVVVSSTFTVGTRAPAASFTVSDASPDPGQAVTLTSTATGQEGEAIVARAWDLDDDGEFDDASGTTATATFTGSGQRRVGHKVRDAAGDVGIRYEVLELTSPTAPTATFTASDTTPRPGQTVTFTSTATDPQGDETLVEQAWDLDGDGDYDDATGPTASRAFPTAGERRVGLRVTDAGGQTDTATLTLRVTPNAAPAASFTRSPESPLVGEEVTFTSTASDPDGTIATQAWDVDGDGQFDDGDRTSASTTFASSGTKTVRLRVTDDEGASDVSVVELVVRGTGSPTASFAVTTPAPRTGTPVEFDATASSDPDGAVAGYAWDLDNDGAFDDATGATAARSYTSTGPKTVRLRVTDAEGNTATASRSFVVELGNRAPRVTLLASRTEPRTGTEITLAARADDPDAGDAIEEYAFDLDGDGAFGGAADRAGTSSRAAVTPAGEEPRTYRVRVTDSRGAAAVAEVRVDPIAASSNTAPVLFASADDSAKRRRADGSGATFTLSADAWDVDDAFYDAVNGRYENGIARWQWDLNGDGDFDDASIDREGPGLRAVSVDLGAGATGDRSHTVNVRVTDTYTTAPQSTTFALELTTYDGNRAPEVGVFHWPFAVQRNVAATFVADARDPDGDAIAGYAWDLDDDGSFDDGTGSRVEATFAERGRRTVRVRVTDADGAAGEQAYSVDVAGAVPVVGIESDPFAPEVGEPVRLTAAARDPDGTVASYAWDLDDDGDFDDAAGASTSRTYPGRGTYPVAVRVTDDAGDQAIAWHTVVVHDPIRLPSGEPAGIGTPAPVASDNAGNPVNVGTRVDPDSGRLTVQVGRGVVTTAPDGCVELDVTFPIRGQASNVVLVLRRPAGDRRADAEPVRADDGSPTGRWRAHLDCVEPGELLVEYDLPRAGGGSDHIGPVPVGGIELIDPQGVVFDVERYQQALEEAGVTEATASEEQKTAARSAAAISGAVVTLERFTNGGWAVVNPDDPGIAPNVNPQVTGADGLYRWDVSAGTYRVRVERPGYTEVTSEQAVIPPPKLDLHVPLVRNARPVAGLQLVGQAVAGQPTTLRSTSSVANGTIAALAWDLDDDGEFDDGAGLEVSRTFAAGPRRVRVRATDADGEADVAALSFAVQPPASGGDEPTDDQAPTGGGNAGGQGDGTGPQGGGPVQGGSVASGGGSPGGGGVSGSGGGSGGGSSTSRADTTPPRVTLALPRGRSARIRALFGRGLPLTVTCSERCQVSVVATVAPRLARSLGLRRGELARVTRALAAGARVRLPLRGASRARRRAARLRALPLRITVTALDAAGNRSVVTRAVRVTR